jgi:hypothetical protein
MKCLRLALFVILSFSSFILSLEECFVIELPVSTSYLSELLSRLDDGWQVEEPILQRTLLHGPRGRHTALEVILRKERERKVIALADDPEVWEFVARRRFAILEV